MLSFYRLPGQLPGEKKILVVRRDFFILLKKVLLVFLLAFLPAILMMAMLASGLNLFANSFGQALMILGGSAYYLFLWQFFFFSFLDYYLDVWIITNERVIDIQLNGFFHRTVAEQHLSKIQDVSSEIKGFFPTMFDYGDLLVQTAGAKERLRFREVPNPDHVRDVIAQLIKEKAKKKHVFV
jgi:hypothetical protein